MVAKCCGSCCSSKFASGWLVAAWLAGGGGCCLPLLLLCAGQARAELVLERLEDLEQVRETVGVAERILVGDPLGRLDDETKVVGRRVGPGLGSVVGPSGNFASLKLPHS